MSTGLITMTTMTTMRTTMTRKTHMRAPRALYASVKTTPLSPFCCLVLFAYMYRERETSFDHTPGPFSIATKDRSISWCKPLQARSVETTYNFEITIIRGEKSLISFANYGNAQISQLRYFASEEPIAKRFAASRRKAPKAPLYVHRVSRRSDASLDVNSFPLLQLNTQKRGQKAMKGGRK